jgi:hypothetical protein
MPERCGGGAARLGALLLVLALLGCGPGTGGTGLPPGADASVAPTTTAPGSANTTAPSVALPDRAPDLAGPIERLDATVIRIAATDLPRERAELLLDDGTAATADALQVGAEARAWFDGARWQVAIRR